MLQFLQRTPILTCPGKLFAFLLDGARTLLQQAQIEACQRGDTVLQGLCRVGHAIFCLQYVGLRVLALSLAEGQFLLQVLVLLLPAHQCLLAVRGLF